MKKIRGLMILTAILFLTGGCSGAIQSEDDSEAYRELFAMDTVMSVRAWGDQAEAAVEEAAAEIHHLDTLLSVGNPSGEVGQINRNGSGTLSEDVRLLTERSLALWEETDGAFDITVYPLMQLWGFTGDHPAVPQEDAIRETVQLCGSDKLIFQDGILTLGKGQGIDFGGIAKGYAGDRIMTILQQHGVDSAVISLGGNVQCLGRKTDGSLWRCGITDPDHPQESDRFLGIIQTEDRAVVTSGGYERFFQEDGKTYHHIMNIRTGYPAETGLRSVTIISSEGLLADGLSTACFVMGETDAVAFWRQHRSAFDMILLTEDDRLLVTAGIGNDFSSERPFTVISD